MQYQRIPFGNPVGRFVFALTDWLVLPLRRVLPSVGKVDTASVVGAYLIVLVQYAILWLIALRGMSPAVVPVLGLFALARLAISGLMGLVLVYAILSWVRADSPLVDIIDRICAPLLRPFRKMIPLVGGIDLSPLALLVLLQIASFVLQEVQRSVVRIS
jgi:YggT family protein